MNRRKCCTTGEVLCENENSDEISVHWNQLSVDDDLYSTYDEYKVK